MMVKLQNLLSASLLMMLIFGCKNDNTQALDLAFAPSDDVELGNQLHAEILANPDEYPLLDEETHGEAINYLQGMCDKIIATGQLTKDDVFDYKVHIIDADVLNAFAAPGGKMYFYTGLIKFLENEDDLMGVMGHEIAHADRRHSVKQMIKNNGIAFLLSAALGENPSAVQVVLAQVASTGASLKFSRSDETEADAYSVDYLAETDYRCDGASVFFQKLDSAGLTSGTPQFLSTHPNPENRVEDIQALAEEKGCSTEYFAPESYDEFKAMLP